MIEVEAQLEPMREAQAEAEAARSTLEGELAQARRELEAVGTQLEERTREVETFAQSTNKPSSTWTPREPSSPLRQPPSLTTFSACASASPRPRRSPEGTNTRRAASGTGQGPARTAGALARGAPGRDGHPRRVWGRQRRPRTRRAGGGLKALPPPPLTSSGRPFSSVVSWRASESSQRCSCLSTAPSRRSSCS